MARLNSMSAARGQGASASASASAVPEGRGDLPPDAAEIGIQQQRTGSEDANHAVWLPRQTGLGLDLDTGRAYPVRFEGAGRGPGWLVRSSRIFSGSREEALTEVSVVNAFAPQASMYLSIVLQGSTRQNARKYCVCPNGRTWIRLLQFVADGGAKNIQTQASRMCTPWLLCMFYSDV